MLSVRPKVAELAFQLFGRSLHPELFEVYRSREVERSGFTARVDITSAGHVIAWRYEGMILTEVAASRQHPLPKKRQLMAEPLKGSCQREIKCRQGVSYEATFSLEPVKPELFWTIQQQLSDATEQDGIVYCFESSGRMAVGAMSYIHVETRSRSLRVQAFHTFPDDYAIVKTESVIRLPRSS